MRRIATATALVLVILLASAGVASADGGQGDGWVDSQTGDIGAGAHNGGQSDGAGGGAGGVIVNLETWLWLDNFAPVGASASAGGVTVSVSASPVSVRWSMGNGDEVLCTTSGTAYDPNRSPNDQHTDCSYTYRHSSAAEPEGRFTVTTTVTWHVIWTATGIAAGGDLGQLSRTTTTQVRVAEVQAVHE